MKATRVPVMARSDATRARLRRDRFTCLVGLFGAALAGAGCTTDQWQRLGYDVGSQYACRQANRERPDASARDLECMSHTARRDADYETYRVNRRQALDDRDTGPDAAPGSP
ncbi:MAG: hypothetical protein IT495_13540 [Gammaproteobacteria bacterium]|nr:hypothetical protein [Gammaproteobacteria bacterium]